MTDEKKLEIITDCDNAEALYHFVVDNEKRFEEFNALQLVKPLSMAQYVYIYKSDDFINYLDRLKQWEYDCQDFASASDELLGNHFADVQNGRGYYDNNGKFRYYGGDD